MARNRALDIFKTTVSLGNLAGWQGHPAGPGMSSVLAFRTHVRTVHAFGVASGNLRSPLPIPSLLLSRHMSPGVCGLWRHHGNDRPWMLPRGTCHQSGPPVDSEGERRDSLISGLTGGTKIEVNR